LQLPPFLPEHRVGGVKRPSGIAVLMLLPHLLQANVSSTISGRTWLMRVTVPRSVASLPAGEMWTCGFVEQQSACCCAAVFIVEQPARAAAAVFSKTAFSHPPLS
jgi:hypothetical protein